MTDLDVSPAIFLAMLNWCTNSFGVDTIKLTTLLANSYANVFRNRSTLKIWGRCTTYTTPREDFCCSSSKRISLFPMRYPVSVSTTTADLLLVLVSVSIRPWNSSRFDGFDSVSKDLPWYVSVHIQCLSVVSLCASEEERWSKNVTKSIKINASKSLEISLCVCVCVILKKMDCLSDL